MSWSKVRPLTRDERIRQATLTEEIPKPVAKPDEVLCESCQASFALDKKRVFRLAPWGDYYRCPECNWPQWSPHVR